MAAKENLPLRASEAATEPPAKRRKLSPPPEDANHDAPTAPPPASQPPLTQSQSQKQKKGSSQNANQAQPSFADVLARLKETTAESRGTCLVTQLPLCFDASYTCFLSYYAHITLGYANTVASVASSRLCTHCGLITNTEAEGGADQWARPALPRIDPKGDAISK